MGKKIPRPARPEELISGRYIPHYNDPQIDFWYADQYLQEIDAVDEIELRDSRDSVDDIDDIV